jgi:hypothetical protein
VRRAALIALVAAALTVALGASAAGSHWHAQAPRMTASILPEAGSACYVGISECSLVPCVEFAGARAAAASLLPGPAGRVPRPGARCGSIRRGPEPTVPIAQIYSLKSAARALPLTAFARRLDVLRRQFPRRRR